jgi:hypothetical protein
MLAGSLGAPILKLTSHALLTVNINGACIPDTGVYKKSSVKHIIHWILEGHTDLGLLHKAVGTASDPEAFCGKCLGSKNVLIHMMMSEVLNDVEKM